MTTTQAIPVQTAIAHCRCGKTVAVQDVWNLRQRNEEAADLWRCSQRIACECGRKPMGQVIRGKHGKRECGTWCTEGSGKTCTCECGGVNHGAAYAAGIAWYAA